eukprot:TRINITY_DN4626_c0_g1_i1.p2 TRINITY_DN4626_c0_g1~~TRINITY_DN4626_c0_g1_i1.p2  ORF type:complete len:192 (-),score=56.87 TRINITY_DN4626_c0_g1_i1:294-869(-)
MDNVETKTNEHPGVSEALQAIYDRESKTPIGVVVAIFLVLALMTVSTLLKGRAGSPSMIGVEVCSSMYWTLTFVPIAFVISGIAFLVHRMIQTNKHKEEIGYQHIEGDIVYTTEKAAGIAAFGMLAGIMAGLLGIGGGMLLNPLMLELHVVPEVTAATSAFMVFWTSLSSTVQYVILDRLLVDVCVGACVL